MLKIALIKWTLTISGGGDRQLLELAYNLQQQGHKVDIFCLDVDKEKCYPELIKKLSVYSVSENKKKEIYHLARYTILKKFLLFIPNYLRKHHNLLMLKNLVTEHNKTVTYDAFNYHEGEVFMIAPYFETEKNFWMLNDLFIKGDTFLEYMSLKLDNFLIRTYYKKFINKIIVLDEMNRKIMKNYLHTDAVVVRSGLDQNKFYKKRVYTDKKSLSLLATGIFFPHRRYEDLIEAINILVNDNKIKNIYLSVIGEPKTNIAYYKHILSLVEKYHLEKNVKFLGKVTEKELIRFYQTADIFIFPNNPQTWGLAVFEAMIAGCATIVSKGAGAHEVLKNNKTAMLVDPEKPKGIADAIKKLTDAKLRKQISLHGQKFVKENISWDNYTDSMVKVFLHLPLTHTSKKN